MEQLKWWQKAVFYQIYPRSFADGNGDGIGDFRGIIAKLDYLQTLGIDAIWLSPHYPSPFLDCGYDISDYSDVAPEYGTLEDFKLFLKEAHAREIRVILDLVLNHTSDQHGWFIESRSSLDNPKRDWFVWRDGKDGAPPNNWASIFGGSAWELDPQTNQYYYHAFLKEQPDLNWRNVEVKQAIWQMIRFWLDMGVDGFRLDAIATIYEHPDLPDHHLKLPKGEFFNANTLTLDEYDQLMQFQLKQPGLHELLQELREIIDEYPGDRVLVGEDEDVSFHGSNDNELHLVFNFPLLRFRRLMPEDIRANQALRLSELPPGAWPCNTLGNHDTSRVWSQYGDGQNDDALMRLHLALMLTLKGTPFLYNGEEIGMTNYAVADFSQIKDTAAINHYQGLIEKLGKSPQEALDEVRLTTRDRCRTPLQWDASPNAGFSPPDTETWLPLNPNYLNGVNVAAQDKDPASLLNFYRQMLQLRRNSPALLGGDYHVLHSHSHEYLSFLRQTEAQTCLVLLNFSDHEQTIIFDLRQKTGQILFSNKPHPEESIALDWVSLAPFQILILELT